MPSGSIELLLLPSLTQYQCGVCSHRLKPLEEDMKSALRKLSSQDVDCLQGPPSQEQYPAINFCNDRQRSDGDEISDVEEEYDQVVGRESGEGVSPRPGNLSLDTLSGEEDKDFETALQQIFYEATPLKLVSAIKGSREKEGLSLGKLTVSWALDVYDPIPSIVSHTRGAKQRKSKKKDNKKYGKKGQKGVKASGKDKKQNRKNARNRFVDSDDDEFDAPDSSYCGGSFLKISPNKVNFSVAEAL